MIDLSFTLFLQWVNFLVLLFIMSKLLFKPISSFLDKRAQEIKQNIDSAEEGRVKAQQELDAAKKELQQAQGQAREILSQTRTEASAAKEAMLVEAKKESAGIVAKTKEEIEREMDKARLKIQAQSVDIGVMIAEAILEKKIDKAAEEELIAKTLTQLN